MIRGFHENLGALDSQLLSDGHTKNWNNNSLSPFVMQIHQIPFLPLVRDLYSVDFLLKS